MKMCRLGRNGPELSAVGLGCMGMSAFYGARDGNESARTLHRAVELGVTFFDSADAHANGMNEEMLGRELKAVRDRVSSPPSSATSGTKTAHGSGSAAGRTTCDPPATPA